MTPACAGASRRSRAAVRTNSELCSAARTNARELATTPSFSSLGARLVGRVARRDLDHDRTGAVARVVGRVVLAHVEAVGVDAAYRQRDDDDQQRDQRRDPAQPAPAAAAGRSPRSRRARRVPRLARPGS